jgi:DNA mismatch repair ATPase MutS
LNEKNNFTNNKLLSYALYITPLIALVFTIVSIIKGEMHPVLSLTILVNWLIYGFNAKKINHLFLLISKKKNLLNNYSNLLKISSSEIFKTPKLENIRTSHEKASTEFKILATIVAWFDQRLNILISPVLNSLFLFDLQCCIRIEKWKIKNQMDVLPWFDSLGEIDVYCCYGNFAYNNPDFELPEFSKDEFIVKTEAVSHPLINRKKRIANDFSLGAQNQIAIITGANMAGKSTFLRTIGINMVLAFTGAPVCARQFKTSVVDIISSMRISDSLKDDVSYFYAELQRLKTIRQKVESGKPILILLDEMLRGTNSKDKQQGSKLFVENLTNFNCLSLVATHDLSLGQLEETYPKKIKNYSFESFLKNNELLFDYQIKEGVAQNTNASFLMKNLGII